MSPVKGLRERLRDGESIICAEGYMREFERRGMVQLGTNTPQVVLDYPHQVKLLHEEFVYSGSDVVEAFTYYGHRTKMQVIGREDEVEQLNMTALRIAREVADETGTLMAGNICNTTSFDPGDAQSIEKTKAMFKEQVEWAVKGQADYIIAETFSDFAEAKLALEAIQTFGKGLPAVVTITAYFPEKTTDDVPICEALQRLDGLGADVVGLNCARGPQVMLPLLERALRVCQCPVAALPVVFRTTDRERTFQSLSDPQTGKSAYPIDTDCRKCSRKDIRDFAQKAHKMGIRYIGLCCGSNAAYIRELAAVYGRTLNR